MSHSPAPWSVRRNGQGNIEILSGEFPNRRVVAIIFEIDPEDEANARVMAAAPKLLAALKARMETSSGQGSHHFAVIQQCREAIAEVEGSAE